MREETKMTASIANSATVTKTEVQRELWGTKESVCCGRSFGCRWKILQHACVLTGMTQGREDELS